VFTKQRDTIVLVDPAVQARRAQGGPSLLSGRPVFMLMIGGDSSSVAGRLKDPCARLSPVALSVPIFRGLHPRLGLFGLGDALSLKAVNGTLHVFVYIAPAACSGCLAVQWARFSAAFSASKVYARSANLIR